MSVLSETYRAKSHGNLISMETIKDELKIVLKGWEIVRKLFLKLLF